MGFAIKELSEATWDHYSEMIERHNGIWGGCWCTWFYGKGQRKAEGETSSRDFKRKLVLGGRSHAALVFDGDRVVGWCQYGSPKELPNIYHKKEYEASQKTVPDYRFTCLFVDKDYRGRGISKIALVGALQIIAQNGGGLVEAYPQDTQRERISASFLYNSTRAVFEELGFRYDRPKGKNHCVMVKHVAPITDSDPST